MTKGHMEPKKLRAFAEKLILFGKELEEFCNELEKPKEKEPDTREFIKWWCEEMEKLGLKYHVVWGKEGAMVKSLLKTYGMESLKKQATYFFTYNDPAIDKFGRTIYAFQLLINRMNTRLTKTVADNVWSKYAGS